MNMLHSRTLVRESLLAPILNGSPFPTPGENRGRILGPAGARRASREPWEAIPPDESPTSYHIAQDPCNRVYTLSSPAFHLPRRRGGWFFRGPNSTGSAALHPRLLAFAPPGRCWGGTHKLALCVAAQRRIHRHTSLSVPPLFPPLVAIPCAIHQLSSNGAQVTERLNQCRLNPTPSRCNAGWRGPRTHGCRIRRASPSGRMRRSRRPAGGSGPPTS